jgi:ketosteroid isomerase-like protein
MAYERQLESLYAAFNARDIDAVLAAMADDVDWPNAWEGGRLHGKEEVRAYWTRQWLEIDARVEPVSFSRRPSGGVAVDVQQSCARATARSRTRAWSCTSTRFGAASSRTWMSRSRSRPLRPARVKRPV